MNEQKVGPTWWWLRTVEEGNKLTSQSDKRVGEETMHLSAQVPHHFRVFHFVWFLKYYMKWIINDITLYIYIYIYAIYVDYSWRGIFRNAFFQVWVKFVVRTWSRTTIIKHIYTGACVRDPHQDHAWRRVEDSCCCCFIRGPLKRLIKPQPWTKIKRWYVVLSSISLNFLRRS